MVPSVILRPALVAAALSGLACSRPILVRPPADRGAREARMLGAVQRLGEPGDWLVIRGYHATDHFVSAVTNAPFSHVAVLDPERNQVIEAEGRGLHATPLPDFMKKAHRLLLLRPQWATDAARQQAAVARARALIGRPYDLPGLVGLNVPDAYYCSELAVEVYRPFVDRKAHLPPVIPPVEMPTWGTVLWDSGPVVE